MSWQTDISIITRVWINDLGMERVYSDSRLEQLIVVAAKYVKSEINLAYDYIIDLSNETITPDPSSAGVNDESFIAFTALKAACLLDYSTFRTKAANEGVRASLGSASLSVGGNLKGYEIILNQGPCALYNKLRMEHEVGNVLLLQAILGPFSGNQFDPDIQNSREKFNNRDGFYP